MDKVTSRLNVVKLTSWSTVGPFLLYMAPECGYILIPPECGYVFILTECGNFMYILLSRLNMDYFTNRSPPECRKIYMSPDCSLKACKMTSRLIVVCILEEYTPLSWFSFTFHSGLGKFTFYSIECG